MKIFNLIFYKLCKGFYYLEKDGLSAWKAVVILSAWLGLYLLIPYGLLKYFEIISPGYKTPKLVAILIYLVLVGLNYFYLSKGKSYENIMEEFEKMKELNSKYGLFAIILFFTLPILVMLLFTFTIWS